MKKKLEHWVATLIRDSYSFTTADSTPWTHLYRNRDVIKSASLSTLIAIHAAYENVKFLSR